ncbi:MAG: Uma2 family endonuclease [Chloroflexi bacterium]|nr:Uma2 family endonuclease [Chloroflexota bacterium]
MTREEEKRAAAVLARREPPPGKLSFEEFLAWCDEDTWAEWVDGEVVVVSPASARHQDLVWFLGLVLGLWVRRRGLGRTFAAPFLMRLPAPLNRAREPDLLFVAREQLDRLTETYLDGPADLVVEIVSPESAARDRGEKLGEYEAGGVAEYWVVDPQHETLEVYRVGPSGRYETAFAGREGVYESPLLPGLRLDSGWLWAERLPVVDALRALGLPG